MTLAASYVAILEDDARRMPLMRHHLLDLLPQYPIHVFDHAGRMIAWLKD